MDQGYYVVQGKGTAPFSGVNFSQGDTLKQNDVIKKIGNSWYVRRVDQSELTYTASREGLNTNAFFSDRDYLRLKATSAGQAFTGAQLDLGNDSIIIPKNQNGAGSFIEKVFSLTSFPAWLPGKKIRFTAFIGQSSDNYIKTNGTDPQVTCNIHVQNTYGNRTNQASSVNITQDSDRLIRISFDYTVNYFDTGFTVYIQYGASAGNAGPDAIILTWAGLYAYSPDLQTLSKLADQDSREKLATSYLDSSKVWDKLTLNTGGEAYNSAVINTAESKLVIPPARSGAGSYLSKGISVTSNNWQAGYLVRIGFFVIESLAGHLQTNGTEPRINHYLNIVNPITGNRNGQSSNATVTRVNSNTLLYLCDYFVYAGDSMVNIIAQYGTGSTNPSNTDLSLEWWGTYAANFATQPIALANSLTGLVSNNKPVNRRLVVRVNPGVGEYTLAQANAAITDANPFNWYEVIIHPGIHEVTELHLKDYVFYTGISREFTIIKGELPDTATASQVELTSTLWMNLNTVLRNLTVTIRNGRYAIHDDNSNQRDGITQLIENCNLIHLGNVAGNWAAQRPLGLGISSGMQLTIKNCLLQSENTEAFYVHTQIGFQRPAYVRVEDTQIIRKQKDQVMKFESMGSGQTNIVEFVNTTISEGYVALGDNPFLSSRPDDQVANKGGEFEIRYVNTQPPSFYQFCRSRALRIRSNSTAAGSSIRISGNAVFSLLGSIKNRDGGGGLAGQSWGYWDISPTIQTSNSLGRRLGNCSVTNKTLSVSVNGGATTNVVFNQDYTNQSNTTILSAINSALSGATVDEYDVTENEFFPLYPNNQKQVKNSSSVHIPRFAAVAYSGDKLNVRLMTNADPVILFAGLAVEPIAPGGTGRVVSEAVTFKSNLPGFSGAISMGSTIGISGTPGVMALSSTNIIARATDEGRVYWKASLL